MTSGNLSNETDYHVNITPSFFAFLGDYWSKFVESSFFQEMLPLVVHGV